MQKKRGASETKVMTSHFLTTISYILLLPAKHMTTIVQRLRGRCLDTESKLFVMSDTSDASDYYRSCLSGKQVSVLFFYHS